jgi:hypothetical protein
MNLTIPFFHKKITETRFGMYVQWWNKDLEYPGGVVFMQSGIVSACGIVDCEIESRQCTGANPTVASYNASVVNFYNATGSLSRFENKNILLYFEKCSSLLQRWRCRCKFKNRRIGSRCLQGHEIW